MLAAINANLFQSSPSIQRETSALYIPSFGRFISILSLYTEGDPMRKYSISSPSIFQSSPSIQRETIVSHRLSFLSSYFNPLPLYRGRRTLNILEALAQYFNPLPLYRGRLTDQRTMFEAFGFQSSPSIQRETDAGR